MNLLKSSPRRMRQRLRFQKVEQNVRPVIPVCAVGSGRKRLGDVEALRRGSTRLYPWLAGAKFIPPQDFFGIIEADEEPEEEES